jgi:hypothetical protein
VRDISEPVPGLRLSCHKLLQHKDLHPAGTAIVAEILDTYRTWSEWLPVASDYMATVGLTDIESSLREYFVREWSSPSTRRLVGACFKHADQTAARNAVLSWLEAASVEDPAWPGTFTVFVDTFGVCEISQNLLTNFSFRRMIIPPGAMFGNDYTS